MNTVCFKCSQMQHELFEIEHNNSNISLQTNPISYISPKI